MIDLYSPKADVSQLNARFSLSLRRRPGSVARLVDESFDLVSRNKVAEQASRADIGECRPIEIHSHLKTEKSFISIIISP